MKNKGILFLIALVIAVIISASSLALAATSPLDNLGITLPTGSITLPTGFDSTTPSAGTSAFGITEPTAAFTATQTSWAAPNYNVSFTDKSTGTIFAYNWDFGDGANSTDQNPVHSYAAAGKYNVTLQVIGAGENSISKIITVAASKPSTVKAPVAAFSTSVSGRTVQFTDKSKNSPTSYLWDFGDKGTSTAKNPKHTYSKAGTYTVSLTAKNSAGSNKTTGKVTVK